MIELMIQGLTSLSNLILTPIDNFIASYIPELSNIFNIISNFINYILSFVVWAISWLPLDTTVIYFLLDILIFRFLWLKFGYVLGMLINWIREILT